MACEMTEEKNSHPVSHGIILEETGEVPKLSLRKSK